MHLTKQELNNSSRRNSIIDFCQSSLPYTGIGCTMFHFVTINHPDEAKEQKRQTALRQHAIRRGIRERKGKSAKKTDKAGFDEVEEGNKSTRGESSRADMLRVARPIDAGFMEPFDALYGSGEQLRTLVNRSMNS
jgi:hypothetical protein